VNSSNPSRSAIGVVAIGTFAARVTTVVVLGLANVADGTLASGTA